MADIDIDELIRQFGNNYPKWVNDAIGSRLETTNKLLKELQKQKTASNPEFKKEVDNRKQINKELVTEKKLVEAQNKSLKETNDLYKNLKQNLGGLVKNIDKFKKDLETMSAQSNTKELVKQSKELSKETAARKELTKTVDRQTINQVTYILTQKELNKTTRILDKQFGGLSKTIDVLVKKINSSDISNSKPVDVDFTAFNKSMMSFQTQMDGVIKKQDEFAKKIQKITSSINEPVNQNNGASDVTENHGKLQNAIDKSKNKLNNFSDSLDKTARSIGESIQSFGDVKNLGSAVSGVMVTLLGNIPKIGLAVAGVSFGAKLYIDEMMIARTAFSQLSTNGFGLGTDLQGLSQIARDGRMSIEDLQNAMAMNKTAFMALGQDAASIFSKLSGTANETSSLFKKFGMSVEETNEFLSNNLEYQRTTGRLRDMSDAQRSIMAEQELMRLAKTQSVFGKSIKEITSSTSDYMQRSSTLANVIQITRGMSADDKQRVMGNFADFRQQVAGSAMTPEMQDMTMKMIAVQIAKQEGRPLLDREQQEMAMLMQQMPELSRYIEQSVAQGNVTEEFTKDVNTILKDQFLNNSEALDRLAIIANASSDQKLKPMADAIIASVGQTFGYDEDEAQKRIDATANIANSTDAVMKAVNEVEYTIANVEAAFKSSLVEIFGQNFGTDLVGTITTNLNQFVDVFKAYTDKVTDPNYTGSIVSDEVKAVATAAGLGYAGYKASRFGNSLGERLANRPPPNRLPPVTPPDSPDTPDSAKSKSKFKFGKAFKAIPYLAPLLAIADGISGINDEEFKEAGMGGSQRFISGAIEGSLGFLDMIAAGGAKFSNYVENTDEYHGSDLSGMFRDWVTGKNSNIIPKFDPSTNIPEHLKNNSMVGGVSGVTLNPDGTINRGGSVVNSWRNSGQVQGGMGTNTLPTTVDDDYQGGLSLTPQGNPDLLLGSDVKDSYELIAQAHHDIMAPVFRELHADTMKNLFIKNTDAIDTIFTKSLDKFLYTKSSIEGIITASGSEQGLSPAQIKQLEVMGMGSMNSGGLLPMEARIGGTGGGQNGYSSGSSKGNTAFSGGKNSGVGASGYSKTQLFNLIQQHEAKNYDELYGNLENIFPNIKPTQMTVDEVLKFQKARGHGQYGSEVKKRNPKGTLSTPIGKYQIVGSTMETLIKDMGLSGNELFDQNMQDKMFAELINRRIRLAESKGGSKQEYLKQFRSEWEGFGKVNDQVLWNAIQEFKSGNTIPNNNKMVKYNMGPNRPFAPDDDLINSVSQQVEKIFGIGSKINIISGQEGDLPQYGQSRHKTGLAADFDIYDSEGNIVTFGDPRLKDFMLDAARNHGIKGIGLGPEYMKGPSNAARFHMDKIAHNLYSGNMDETWGSLANKYETEIEEAMAFFDKNTKIVQQTMDPDRNEPIQMKYTTSEEEAKVKERLKTLGASESETKRDDIERYLREIANETKRNRRATEKNGSGLAPGSPSC